MWLFKKRRPPSAALVVDPAAGDPQARALIDALTVRDRRTAAAVFGAAADADTHAYLMEVAARVDGVQDWIGEWIAADPGSTLPVALRGCHGVYWAWEARGTARASATGQDQFREFHRRLRIAENALDEAVDRDPDDTTARTWLVTSSRGRQVDPQEAATRFAEVVERHPHHMVAHEQRLQYLCAKWFGSHDQMLAFARQATAAALDGSQLPVLLVIAHIEKWLSLPRGEDDEYITSPQVRADMLAAVGRSLFHPAFAPAFGWVPRANAFAMGLEMAGEHPAAARVFDLLGDRVGGWTWNYCGDAVEAFTAARTRAYAHRD